jgi:UTP--glucose-1-phosphate uridylyltransferase
MIACDEFGYLTAIVDVALANPVYGAEFLALIRDQLAQYEGASDLALRA